MKVCFCLPGSDFSLNFLKSWTATLSALNHYGIEWQVSGERGSFLAALRNKIAGGDPDKGEYQLPHDGADYTHQFWIDSDQVWHPADVLQLLDHGKDIVSACIHTADGDYALHKDGERLKEVSEGLFEVDSCGFGFVCIKREVFQKIAYPWFCHLPARDGRLGFDGEDVSFCRKAREAGFSIFADGSCMVGHEKRQII